jgi:hypothetical protein
MSEKKFVFHKILIISKTASPTSAYCPACGYKLKHNQRQFFSSRIGDIAIRTLLRRYKAFRQTHVGNSLYHILGEQTEPLIPSKILLALKIRNLAITLCVLFVLPIILLTRLYLFPYWTLDPKTQSFPPAIINSAITCLQNQSKQRNHSGYLISCTEHISGYSAKNSFGRNYHQPTHHDAQRYSKHAF